MEKWIRAIARLRWAVLAAWLAAGLFSLFALPDMQAILRQSEQRFLPDDAGSVQATRLLQNIDPDKRSLSGAVLVYSREDGLRESDIDWMEGVLTEIESRASELGLAGVVSSSTHPELAERLSSKDGTTRLALLNFPGADFEDGTRATLDGLKEKLSGSPEGTQAVLTGSAPLSQDYQRSAEKGLRRTELLTVGLVFVILFFLFRSPVTPVLPLATIGVSYIVSKGILGVFAQAGMPLSHFTESFLIAVLFGAGTDYCILLIQRYKEELQASGSDDHRVAALCRTMNGVGHTILYSAGTVFAAFLLLGLAEFGLYRSAVGVALGMLVTVAAALTLAPALLLALGSAAFWPSRRPAANRTSRVWEKLSSLAAKRAVLVLVVSVVGLAPIAFLFQGNRTFDDLSEIDPRLESVVGFRQAEKAFSAGEVFPATIAFTSKQSMRTASGLAALEQVSAQLTQLPYVSEVRSAVRPLGKKAEQLTVPGQLRGPNVQEVIRSMIAEQQEMAAGLQQIAIHSAPLSQGLLGILSSARQLEEGLSRLIQSQLGGIKRITGSDSGHGKDETNRAGEQALDYYLSPDGRTAKFEVIIKPHPYSDEAMDAIPDLARFARDSMDSTWLEEPQAFVTGVSAKYGELRDISVRDFARTGTLVLAGIAAVLALLLRSFVKPLCLLLSLGLNYLITMGILEFLFVKAFGYPGLSWTVSFFVFVIVVALGVDYGIFLMSRFKEESRRATIAEAMSVALSRTGGVIRSAAAIMASTFGALAFSGLDTLVQIGVGALIGLLLYATLFMGLIVPAMIHLLDRNRRTG